MRTSPSSRTRRDCFTQGLQRRAGLRHRGRGRPDRQPGHLPDLYFTGSVPTARSSPTPRRTTWSRLSFEARRQEPTVILDDADLDFAVDLAIEQYATPARCARGHPAAGPGGHLGGVHRAVRGGPPRSGRATLVTRTPRSGPTSTSGTWSGSRGSSSGPRRTARRSCGGERNGVATGTRTTRPRSSWTPRGAARSSPRGGLRPGVDPGDVRHRRRGPGDGQRHRVRACRVRRHRRPRAAPRR